MCKKLVCLIFLAFLPGLSGVPNLVNPGSGGNGIDTLDGYKLQTSSPCIAAGTDTDIDYNDPNYDNGGLDFWSNPLPDVNALDIGAHQLRL